VNGVGAAEVEGGWENTLCIPGACLDSLTFGPPSVLRPSPHRGFVQHGGAAPEKCYAARAVVVKGGSDERECTAVAVGRAPAEAAPWIRWQSGKR